MNPKVFSLVLNALQVMPSVISAVENVIKGSGNKKDKALEITNVSLQTLDVFAPGVRTNPKFQDAVLKAQEAILFAAKVGEQLAAEKAGE